MKTSGHAYWGEHANETYKTAAGPKYARPRLTPVYTKQDCVFLSAIAMPDQFSSLYCNLIRIKAKSDFSDPQTTLSSSNVQTIA
jgi:hypothetical protein